MVMYAIRSKLFVGEKGDKKSAYLALEVYLKFYQCRKAIIKKDLFTRKHVQSTAIVNVILAKTQTFTNEKKKRGILQKDNIGKSSMSNIHKNRYA